VGELLPVLGGLLLGGLVFHLRPPGLRLPWLLAGAVVVGVLASWINGELEISPTFILVDVPLALVGAAIGGYVHDRVAASRSPEPGGRSTRLP
jgi:uncharacterized membrane protein YeaQ/YmgE (transglycosylase-associated protein family)